MMPAAKWIILNWLADLLTDRRTYRRERVDFTLWKQELRDESQREKVRNLNGGRKRFLHVTLRIFLSISLDKLQTLLHELNQNQLTFENSKLFWLVQVLKLVVIFYWFRNL